MTETVGMYNAPDQPIRKFNPGTFQSDEEVIRQFVVRHGEFDVVLEVMRGNIDARSCQHMLIVGPRGQGKTMLLARVCAEMRSDDTLFGSLFPVRFMEESQEIVTLADFWFEALFYIAQANATDNPEFSRELFATHTDLTARWRDTTIADEALAAVLEAADRLGKTLVLMVENLQALPADVDTDFGWQLRKTLQSEPQIMLLATATSQFKGLNDAKQPFFELFRVINLQPLDTDACQRLWSMVSGETRKSREIQPLRILTGGCPRLLVIVATFARHRSLRQLLEDLVALVDDHTEYFRGHLEVIAKTERRVYLAILDLWQPSSPSEIASRARMDIRAVSALLGRLVDRGAVLVEGTGRKRLYSASARLYSIYYKLRRERDEAALVQHLIQFMTVFYGDDDWTEIAKSILIEARQAPVIHEGFMRALAAGVPVAAHFSTDDAPEIQEMVAMALLDKGIAHVQRDEYEAAIDAYDNLVAQFGDSDALEAQIPVALALYNKGMAHGLRDECEAALDAYDNLISRFSDSDEPVIQVHVAKALFNKSIAHGQRGDSEAALGACDNMIARFDDSDDLMLQLHVALALFHKGVAHDQQDESAEALNAYNNLVAHFGKSEDAGLQIQVAKALFNKGVVHGKLRETEAALKAYDNLVAWFGDSDSPVLKEVVAMALVNKGYEHGQRGESEAALDAHGGLIAKFGDSDDPALQAHVAEALVLKGINHGQRDEYEAALDAHGSLAARFGHSEDPELLVQVAIALFNMGITYSRRDETRKALGVYNNMVVRFGDSDDPKLLVHVAKALFNMGITYGQLDESKAALSVYENLIARFDDSDDPELQVMVAQALIMRGNQQIVIGCEEDSLRTAEKIERRFGAYTENERITFVLWLAKLMKTHALILQNERPAALDEFRSVCATFILGNEAMLQEIMARVPALIAAGASTHELSEILSADRKTADTLAPLVVALRQMAGESVRASAEVIEVAADVRKRIEYWRSAAPTRS